MIKKEQCPECGEFSIKEIRCDNCGQILDSIFVRILFGSDTILEGTEYVFCSLKCAKEFLDLEIKKSCI